MHLCSKSLLILTALLLLALPAFLYAVPVPRESTAMSANELAKAEKAVKDYLQGKFARAPLVTITDQALRQVFPDHVFFSLIFPMYPVAMMPPAPLSTQNLFIVSRSGKLQHITDAKGLENFFKAQLSPTRSREAARLALRAWLRVAEVFFQDGFMQFSIPADGLTVESDGTQIKASGKLVAQQGGKGQVSTVLTFDAAGKLVAAQMARMIREGVRPICQATKLLDPDPIVRAMAEKDILVMGRAAKEYLDEQRAKASPELKKAIDRVWQRIVDEGW